MWSVWHNKGNRVKGWFISFSSHNTPDTAIIRAATTTKWISNGAAAKHKRKLLIYLHYAGIYYVNHHIFGMGGGKCSRSHTWDFPHFFYGKNFHVCCCYWWRERKKETREWVWRRRDFLDYHFMWWWRFMLFMFIIKHDLNLFTFLFVKFTCW